MDAAFDDSGSDEDEEGDENVPLARSIPAAASATGGRGGGGGGGATVVWSVDENREEQQAEIRQPTPSRTGAGLQDPLTSVGIGETRALGGGDGNLIGMDADERAGGYDFDRDYVSSAVFSFRVYICREKGGCMRCGQREEKGFLQRDGGGKGEL